MQKQKLIIALLAIGLAISCKKEHEVMNESINDSEMMLINAQQFQYYQFGTDITEADLIANPDDQMDEAYNKVELALSLSLLKIYEQYPVILSDLINKANSTTNKSYNLFVYANENPNVNAIFNSVFSSRFNDFANYNNDWKSYVQAKYKYDINYIPFVMFANQGNINFNATPYVAAPFEVNENKFPNFDDNIPMWVKTPTGSNMTTINYEMAKNITNPILIINNGKLGDESAVYKKLEGLVTNTPPVDLSLLSCHLTTHVHEKLKHIKTQINYRYERGNYSEYSFVWGTTVGYNPLTFNWTNKYDEVKAYKNGIKIHKNDIGKLIDFEFDIYHKDMYPNQPGQPALCFDIPYASGSIVNKTFAVGAFEHDWYAGYKKVYKINSATGIAPIEFRDVRKYESEWYFLDPNTNTSYPFGDRNPTPNSIYYNFNKGHLQLLRTY